MRHAVLLRMFSSLTFAAVILVNVLANTLPINGLNTGEVSDLYPSLFTPAGITFSIWSVIYLLLLGFIIFAWVNRSDDRIDKLLPWFIVTCVLNATWILVWHNLLPVISVVVMLGLLLSLLRIFLMIHRAHFNTMGESVWVSLPFTLYFAWICVATIANISALLVSFGWRGGFLSEQTWTILMMATAAILAWQIVLHYGASAFVLVVMWALLGIYLRWNDTSNSMISLSALVMEGLLFIVLIYSFRKRKIT